MRFAIVDTQGLVVTAHNDDTVSELPQGGAPLTEQEWDTRFDLHWTGEKWERMSPEVAEGGGAQ